MEYEQITPLTQEQIEQIIPHRRPFRFIDEILEVEFGKRAVGMLNDLSTSDYDFLRSHFPTNQIIPGAIILEALTEVGAIALLGLPQNKNKIAVLAGYNRTRLRRIIKPDDVVRLEAEITHLRSNFGRGRGRAYLEDTNQVAVESTILFGLVDQL